MTLVTKALRSALAIEGEPDLAPASAFFPLGDVGGKEGGPACTGPGSFARARLRATANAPAPAGVPPKGVAAGNGAVEAPADCA